MWYLTTKGKGWPTDPTLLTPFRELLSTIPSSVIPYLSNRIYVARKRRKKDVEDSGWEGKVRERMWLRREGSRENVSEKGRFERECEWEGKVRERMWLRREGSRENVSEKGRFERALKLLGLDGKRPTQSSFSSPGRSQGQGQGQSNSNSKSNSNSNNRNQSQRSSIDSFTFTFFLY